MAVVRNENKLTNQILAKSFLTENGKNNVLFFVLHLN